MPVDAQLTAVVRQLGTAVLDRLPALTDRLVSTINAHDPAYDGRSAVPPEDLWHSCHDNLERVLQALTHTVPVGVDRYDAPRATGRLRSEQQIPLQAVLHSYRLGGRLIWEALVDEARRRGESSVDTLLDAATSVWDVVDSYSSEVGEAYRRRQEELSRRDEERRATHVDALVDGRVGARDIATAAAALDLPERGRYVVVVAAHDGARQPFAAPEQALAVRGLRSAWRARADRVIGLVALGTVDLDDGAGGAAGLVAILRPHAGGRAGVSPVVTGLAAVAAAYRLGELALGTVPIDSAGVAALDEHLAEALLVGTPDIAARLARRTLGPILDLEPTERTMLLHTLEVWLSATGSVGRAATELYCHRNTVLNRLRRVESLTGHSLDDAGDLVSFGLALKAVRLWPPRLAAPHPAPARRRPLAAAGAAATAPDDGQRDPTGQHRPRDENTYG